MVVAAQPFRASQAEAIHFAELGADLITFRGSAAVACEQKNDESKLQNMKKD